jgi:hypothetical protein
MNQPKNTQPEKEAKINQIKHNQFKRNYTIKENETLETVTKDADLKPTIDISKNVHTTPAEEQQFENNV